MARARRMLTVALLAFIALSLARVALTRWLPGDPAMPPAARQADSTSVDSAMARDTTSAAVTSSTRADDAAANSVDLDGSRPGAPTEYRSPPATAVRQAEPDSADTRAAGGIVTVYYFHGSVRCKTCRTIEDYTRGIVQGTFGTQLEAGRLAFQTVNLDMPRHEHFVDDFQLTSRVVVVDRVAEGRRTSYRRLEQVWDLVKDSTAFDAYLSAEIHAMLGVN